MKEEEELDYMSNDFIQMSQPPLQSSIHIKHTKQASKTTKSFKEIQEERRQEGLNSFIPEDNKGFKMLKMMGYKQGTGLGKNEEGIAEPIPMNLKRGRSGLGKEEQKKRKIEQEASNKENLLVDFKYRMKGQFSSRKIEGQLRAALLICKNLDEDAGIQDNPFFEDEDEEEEENDEQKQKQIEYKTQDETTTHENRADIQDGVKFRSLPVTHRFEEVSKYMRTKYWYCFFCGAKFDSQEDLEKNCPGDTEEDHE